MPDTTSEVTSLGSVAGLLANTLRSCNVDPDPLFRQAGIDLPSASDPDARIPTQRIEMLLGLAVEATGNPCIGLLAARQFQPAILHGLGLAWLTSDTLREALNRLVRYSHFVNPAWEYHVEIKPNTTDLVVAVPDIFSNIVHVVTDVGMAVFLRMCQITIMQPILPVHVALQRPSPPCKEEFVDMFGPSIEYSATVNRLCFDSEQVNQPLTTANPELARINDKAVVDYLRRFDHDSIAKQVRSKLIEQLPGGVPKQENIAEALQMSLRSLQRRLKEEETSFKELLEDIRKALAAQYLREPHRSIGEITYLLGFSERGNFNRAFKRWTGKTPREFRLKA
jgi:AraC-like DNA-binding protein